MSGSRRDLPHDGGHRRETADYYDRQADVSSHRDYGSRHESSYAEAEDRRATHRHELPVRPSRALYNPATDLYERPPPAGSLRAARPHAQERSREYDIPHHLPPRPRTDRQSGEEPQRQSQSTSRSDRSRDLPDERDSHRHRESRHRRSSRSATPEGHARTDRVQKRRRADSPRQERRREKSSSPRSDRDKQRNGAAPTRYALPSRPDTRQPVRSRDEYDYDRRRYPSPPRRRDYSPQPLQRPYDRDLPPMYDRELPRDLHPYERDARQALHLYDRNAYRDMPRYDRDDYREAPTYDRHPASLDDHYRADPYALTHGHDLSRMPPMPELTTTLNVARTKPAGFAPINRLKANAYTSATVPDQYTAVHPSDMRRQDASDERSYAPSRSRTPSQRREQSPYDSSMLTSPPPPPPVSYPSATNGNLSGHGYRDSPQAGQDSSSSRDHMRQHDDSQRASPVNGAAKHAVSNGTQDAVTTAMPAAVKPQAEPEEVYQRLVQVGEGTFGKVYKARNRENNRMVALKRIRMEQERDGFPVTAVREIKLLQSLSHANVVTLLEMMVSQGHVYMVFEYLDYDLTGVLHHPQLELTAAHNKSIMQQFLSGLQYIHSRNVLHRDLKGSNILLDRSGNVKLADFGLARFYVPHRNNDYTNRVITQWYKPPELLFGGTVYGEEVDMFSAGCIFVELFTSRPIFQGQDEIDQLSATFKIMGTPTLDDWPEVADLPWFELVKPKQQLPNILRETYYPKHLTTEAAVELALKLLANNPAKRWSATQALASDYFSEEPAPEIPSILGDVKGDWHELESKKHRRKKREEDNAKDKAQEKAQEKVPTEATSA
ncbi:uncharacterized protein L969DRAFT_78413 [Mixia osmundae IAM 14324]|uniref:Protein kinase domain-containing protein n=1 Tax=Mixia osmundae (strain CBS 9802 / IAM 14324 / JCM 22182 / KY 12970) TaxID=764103 RepID=G7DWI4_MIXOS|nr:uncharacterized protein L969DRAFT_78413 [Mixia osmundae IAM 14324]KEI37346.1 hypothetical protein L969DRAFT_78413 [Mixia osmundae IAM 14324]GAA94944.1 hypothetical protein E5Q_01599 [Mixia osmundae IAM 14324]